MARSKEGLFTQKDRERGLHEKRGIDMGNLLSAEDKRRGIDMGKKGLLTDKDRKEGLM